MDLNATDALCYRNQGMLNCRRNDDYTLQLEYFGINTSMTAGIRDPQLEESQVQDVSCMLVLGLGPTPSSHRNNYSSVSVIKSKEAQGNANEGFSLQLGPSRRMVDTVISNEPNASLSRPHISERDLLLSVLDEGSSTAKTNAGGYIPSLLLAPRLETGNGAKGLSKSKGAQHHFELCEEPSGSIDGSLGLSSSPSIIQVIHNSNVHNNHPKKCRSSGCSKGARGASGLCIAHGGGQRCQKPGCSKGAESRTAFCKAHGGGRRCEHLGCTKSAEGKTDFCIAHGGGRRCGHFSCNKAARGKSGLCIRHGGGKRCSVEGCARSAEGQAGLCISHGGGRRCQYPECNKGAQGSTMHCKAHGGGKRCMIDGCSKGAEGSTSLCKGHGGGKRCLHEGGGICTKSVHGGTDYCVAHGGGKRCAVAGCTKSARGRTDCCVGHGGGKRCKFEGCGKSAQGSTDFCKAHGGGKRCTWAEGCEKFARGKSGLCTAHGNMMFAMEDQKPAKTGTMNMPGFSHGFLSASTTIGSSIDNDYSSSAVSGSSENIVRWPLPVQTQGIVPRSMMFPSSSNGVVGAEDDQKASRVDGSLGFAVPEGRVHGGELMFLLGGNFHAANVSDNVS